MSTLVAFGDSITAGTGASDQAHRYIEKVAAAKSWTLTNNGVAGARLNDPGVTDAIYATTVTNSDNYTLLIGTNNMHSDNTNISYQDSYRANLLAVLAWLSLPNKQKAINRDSETGTWTTNASSIYGGMGKKSTTVNSTMTFTTRGNVVYIGYIRTNSGAGSFSVTVDGTLKATVSTVGSVDSRSDSAGAYGAALVRIPDLTDTTHTVVITVTSATNSLNTVFIDWVSGNGVLECSTGPNIWVGSVILGTAASYTAVGGSDMAVGQYNSIIGEVASQLASDGLKTVHVDCINSLNVSTDMDTDGIHPNDTGHDNISKAFLANMSADPHDRSVTNVRNTQWRALTLTNGWVNFGGGWSNAEVMKDSAGMVHVHGMIKSGTIGSFPLTTLPQGYRPANTICFPTRSNNAFAIIEVYADGRVNPLTGSNAHFGLDSIQFMAEQ